jgi:hypothetical protein
MIAAVTTLFFALSLHGLRQPMVSRDVAVYLVPVALVRVTSKQHLSFRREQLAVPTYHVVMKVAERVVSFLGL